MLPSDEFSLLVAEYLLFDRHATSGAQYSYRLIEQEVRGKTRVYGPFTLDIKSTIE